MNTAEMYIPLYPEESSAQAATVLVTGATGFVAGPIIERLLAAGHTVHGTVRDPSKEALLAKLKSLPGAAERLKIFKADLLEPASFAEAINGCRFVLHTASPFWTPDTVAEVRSKLLEPAIQGTKTVLDAVNACQTVERVVLTSSVAALGGDSEGKGKGVPFDEGDWANDVSETCLPYYLSKKLAEEKAWEMAKAQNRWKLVTVNPGMVVGPPVGDRADGTSISLVSGVFQGKFAKAPLLGFGYVDVRDVAAAHCVAMVHPKAEGRYVCVEGSYNFHEIGAFIAEKYPKQRVPTGGNIPKWILSVIGPFVGMRRDMVKMQAGKTITFNNSKIQKELGFRFHPTKVAVQDMCARLVEIGLLTPAA